MTKVYDFVIDQYLDSNTNKNNLQTVDDNEVLKMYKNKIERKRDNSLQQRSQNYQISRDFQIVFVKDNKCDINLKTNKCMNILSFLFKRRLAFGIQKIKQNNRDYEKSLSQWSISESDSKMPFDYKKALQVFEDLDDIFKRKNQLYLVFGFIKISFEQKQIMRKRQRLISNLECMRIEKVFSILKNFHINKKQIGIQTQLLNEIHCQSVIQKINSVTTLLIDSFVSIDQTKQSVNPFVKTKNKKSDFTYLNINDSKLSNTSLQTKNFKMSKVQDIIKRARLIRESYNKTQLKKQKQDKQDQEPIFNKQVSHSLSNVQLEILPIQKNIKIIQVNNFKQKQNNIHTDNTNQNTIFNTVQSQVQQTKRIPKKSSVTNKQSQKIEKKIHNIIQPVIQQVIQPIHYYHYPVNYFTTRSNHSQYKEQNIQYVKARTIYRPIVKNKQPDFNRIYSITPRPKNIWF